ncbi:LysR family transcriptional regulator [Amycolatopsis sp. NPDC049159]|uniref:LysR family transcriptional regulator n=1 Tax=Amycolatopsis sp. NPDC049159 TaxID=3157210 RepID=UPI0033E31FD2
MHFGRTAEWLHLSTAQVSQPIRKLERRIGVPLFTRTSRRVELTAVASSATSGEGSALRWSRRSSPRGQRHAASRVRRRGGRAAPGRCGRALPAAGAGLPGRVPRGAARQVLPLLREGEVDVVPAGRSLEAPDLVTGPVLVREPRFLTVAAAHPFRATRVGGDREPRAR